jgi:iron(II)-dependent oxidoreductase
MRSVDATVWMATMAAPGAVVFSSVLTRIPAWLGGSRGSAAAAALKKQPLGEPVAATADALAELAELSAADRPACGGEAESLVDEMLSQGRYALLLRPQLMGNLTAPQLSRAHAAQSAGMCLVPEGEVVLHRSTGLPEEDAEADVPSPLRIPLRVAAYYLDRYPVTNSQFQQFVRSGGYEQMAIWDQQVLPAVLDFVDQTGHPGPRFWRDGRYPRGEDHHPVVGVSWFEASAYSRWTGKRLPTDAEWIKAGSWPVAISGHPLLERRYPWGEAIDHDRANLWSSGPGRTVPVDHFPGGVSVGGVQQLIGNVWEWTVDRFALEDDADQSAAAAQPKMKSIRGGAFDTYLDCQATCHFQSGDQALARKHNIGFRCAISLCDLSKPGDLAGLTDSEHVESSLVETHA